MIGAPLPAIAMLCVLAGCALRGAHHYPAPTLHVPRTDDFTLDGTGRAGAWPTVAWTTLHPRQASRADYTTRMKILYSATGVYVLLEGTDRHLTATFAEDFAPLWTEDVFEIFFWPDQRLPLYFEYEISPLGAQLPLLIPNIDNEVRGWRPWGNEPRRRIRTAVNVDGPQRAGADIDGWRAEVFIPFELLRPLANRVPRPGTRWRANFYRIDYDTTPPVSWDWARVGPSFHDFRRFGTLIFQ